LYATTAHVPPLPAGGAVEFAVDYAAGTCRVAFYKPPAVEGGFKKAPYAKMELRFLAMEAFGGRKIPARLVPTAAASLGMEFYPALTSEAASAVYRFVGV
jgi:hypothetical protein